jgi:hypothetical protein
LGRPKNKNALGNPRAKFFESRYRGRLSYFFFFAGFLVAVFFAPPAFLVAFFIV